MHTHELHPRLARSMVRAALYVVLLGGVAACTRSVPSAQEAAIRSIVDEGFVANEPLCIAAGPFPLDSAAVRGTCDKCQALYEQGFLARTISGDDSFGSVSYDLTDLGRRVYRTKADAALLALVRRRLKVNGRPGETPDMDALAKPRMCFGQTRFHAVVDSLAPVTMGAYRVFSVKVVNEARDTSGLLFDPRTRALGLPLPEVPKPGKPALYPPGVMSFDINPDGSLDTDDMRYGRWVNEP
ncbi:hypothetical protein [Cognatilysobacter lacus]|uniref:Uncharacterized protein n=1 Tax=Cognatilysobacter lacus TaxID=1643323 RepID=A0A5D8Z7A9_9GAMM|nr:hypothetical protein [Lysobacter lacus]TZF90778.1 hypothetical protein FW784_04010 [Lysobacter lacus]